MARKPERHFRRVWELSMVNVVLCSLPLDVLGWVPWWEWFATGLAVHGFAWFLGTEWAAGGVEDPYGGTKTNWLYWTITDRWPRVLLGAYIGLVLWWRYPEFGTMFTLPGDRSWWLIGSDVGVNDVLGLGMTMWLPPHYWRQGMKGPVDVAVIWFAERTGLAKLFGRVRA